MPNVLLILVPLATGMAAAPRHLGLPGHAACDFHNNSQLYDPGSHFTLPPRTANSPQACCDICGANPECCGAVLYGEGCYQKTKVLPIVPMDPGPGVVLVACVLTGRPAPPPPPPPPPSTISLPTFLASDMVLQMAPLKARLWGNATVGTTVTVRVNGVAAHAGWATAAADGTWSIDLDPRAGKQSVARCNSDRAPSGEPYQSWGSERQRG